jgi:uncharacterized protein
MKLHEHRQARMHLISRYGNGAIQINSRDISGPCLVAPDCLLTDWPGSDVDLSTTALEALWALDPQIVLIGGDTAWCQQWQPLRSRFTARQIGLEWMDLGAACRTYNVLAQEDRRVVALLRP